MEMSNYEEQTYFIDSEALSPQALEKASIRNESFLKNESYGIYGGNGSY